MTHITKEGLLQAIADMREYYALNRNVGPILDDLLTRAAELSAQESKPVAWQVTEENGALAWVTSNERVAWNAQKSGAEVKPLYAAPSVSAQDASTKDGNGVREERDKLRATVTEQGAALRSIRDLLEGENYTAAHCVADDALAKQTP